MVPLPSIRFTPLVRTPSEGRPKGVPSPCEDRLAMEPNDDGVGLTVLAPYPMSSACHAALRH